MRDLMAGPLLDQRGIEIADREAAHLLPKPGSKASNNAVRLREAAKEFEALFIAQMLSVMRETIEESGLTEQAPGQSVYAELFDQELARTLAGRGALGISDMLLHKLSEQAPETDPGAKPDDARHPSAVAPAPQGNDIEEIPDFRMPVHARLSSDFGIRKDPFTHDMRFHRGVDIAAPAGTSVGAAHAGRVVFSGFEKGYGNTVVVQHAAGFQTRYAHLGKLLVSEGEILAAGQALGTVSSTGRSTGPHLHFEVSRYGNAINPKTMLTE